MLPPPDESLPETQPVAKQKPPGTPRKVAMLTPGAGGMICGSCLHDNLLVKSLRRLDIDACLVPLYTPLTTDTVDVSIPRVFFGGVNVFLQQKTNFSRWIPQFVEQSLDNPGFLRWLTRRNMETNAENLGELTISMLKGEDGRQHREVDKLCNWLANQLQPSVVIFSNLLVAGSAPTIKRRLGVPIVVLLQGDHVFLDHLPASDRQQAIQLIRSIAPSVDLFLTHSRFYRDYMENLLGLSDSRFQEIPLAVDTDVYQPRSQSNKTSGGDATAPRIGYLARMAPEKGLHVLCEAFVQLRRNGSTPPAVLAIAGWSGPSDQAYVQQCVQMVTDACGTAALDFVGEVDLRGKLAFLQSLDVLSVPCTFGEPKGMYALEAMACGVPVVQPSSGAFPEMIASTGGGLLFDPNRTDELAARLDQLLRDKAMRRQLGERGRQAALDQHAAVTAGAAVINALESLKNGLVVEPPGD